MSDEIEKEMIRKLTGKQARFLRGIGHHFAAKVTIGKEGLSSTLIAATKAQLLRDELVKVRVGNGCEIDRREAAETLALKADAAIAQVLGKTFLLFRENPDRKESERIVLP